MLKTNITFRPVFIYENFKQVMFTLINAPQIAGTHCMRNEVHRSISKIKKRKES